MSDEQHLQLTNRVLLHLIRLLAAELVAGAHRDDANTIISAMAQKIEQAPLPDDTTLLAARAAFAGAREMLIPVAAKIREHAAEARVRDAVAATSPTISKELQ